MLLRHASDLASVIFSVILLHTEIGTDFVDDCFDILFVFLSRKLVLDDCILRF